MMATIAVSLRVLSVGITLWSHEMCEDVTLGSKSDALKLVMYL